MMVDLLSRPNRPQKVVRLAEYLLELGLNALVQFGAAMVKCGYAGLARVLQHLLTEERNRAWSQPNIKSLN